MKTLIIIITLLIYIIGVIVTYIIARKTIDKNPVKDINIPCEEQDFAIIATSLLSFAGLIMFLLLKGLFYLVDKLIFRKKINY